MIFFKTIIYIHSTQHLYMMIGKILPQNHDGSLEIHHNRALKIFLPCFKLWLEKKSAQHIYTCYLSKQINSGTEIFYQCRSLDFTCKRPCLNSNSWSNFSFTTHLQTNIYNHHHIHYDQVLSIPFLFIFYTIKQ